MNNQYFFCYNKYISKQLESLGIHNITVALDLKKRKVFSLYLITPELDAALKSFKNK